MIRTFRNWLTSILLKPTRTIYKTTPRAAKRNYRPLFEYLEDRTTPSANPLGAQFLANVTLSPPENAPAVAVIDASPAGGNFVAVWQSYGTDGDGYGIYAQMFDKSGQAIGGQPAFQVNMPLSLIPTDPALGNQISPTVASDGAGHFVIAWQSENQATGDYDVFYRQGSFSAGTLNLQNQVQANTLFAPGDQIAPTAAMDATGRFVIAWQSQNLATPTLGYDVYAKQGTLAGGLSAGNEFLVNVTTAGDQTNPTASINASSGDFVVAWVGPDPTSAEGAPAIFFNVFTPGLANTGDVRANSAIYHDVSAPDVAMNTSGTIVFGWQVEGVAESGSDVFGRRFSFSTAGTPHATALATSVFGANDFQLNTTSQGPQRAPAVGIDDNGNFLAAWQTQHQDGFSWAIFGRRYDATSNTFSAEELINKGTQSGPQTNPEVSMTGAGRTVVVWLGPDVPIGAEEGEGGHKPSIHAHVYDTAGATSVGAGEVLLSTYIGIEDSSAATAMDAAGNFVVVWQSWEDTGDGSDFGIYAKLFQANGKPIDLNENGLDDDSLLVNTTTAGSQSNPAVAMDASGNFVVVWQSALQDGSGMGIYARRYDASNKDWAPAGEFRVNTTTTGDQTLPKVAMDARGNFIVVWQSKDGINSVGGADSTGIFGQRYAADGTTQGGQFAVNQVTDYNQVGPVIAMNANGQFVVGWVSDHNIANDALDSEKSIFARWFQASGAPIGTTEFLVNDYVKDGQEHPTVAIDINGNFVFAWQSINQEMNLEGAGSSWGVYARQFTVDALPGTITPLTKEFRVNETVDGPQRFPAIGIDQSGHFVISWQSIRQDASSWAILARQYNASGTAEGPEAVVNTYTDGPEILPVIAQRGTGDFTIFWEGLAPGHLEGVSGQQFHFIRDDFNRGNFPSLGPDWTARIGNYDIHDNVAAVQTPFGLATLNKVSLADVSVEGYLTLGGGLVQLQGLVARYSGLGDTNMYWAGLVGREGDFTGEIWRNIGGVWTQLFSKTVDQGEGLVRFELIGDSLKLFLNNQLVGFCFDTALPNAGLMGIRGGEDATLDNFSYTSLVKAKATSPFRDFFYLSNGSELNAMWTESVGHFADTSGHALGEGLFNLATVNGISTGDISVQALATFPPIVGTPTQANTDKFIGLVARYSGPSDNNEYIGNISRIFNPANPGTPVFQAAIYRILGGVPTLLAVKNLTTSGDGTLRFDLQGSSLKLYLNGALLLNANDSAITAGTVGMRVSEGSQLDSFAATPFIQPVRTLPFGPDMFTANPPNNQLNADWQELAGNFNVSTNQAVGLAAFNLATLTNLSVANIAVQADINFTGDNQFLGLVGRHSGIGDSNEYIGNISRFSSTSFRASIYRIVNGVATELGFSLLTSATGTLRFELVGPSLKLFVNNALVAFAQDTTPTLTSGSVGMRISGGNATGPSFDNFAATALTSSTALPFVASFVPNATSQLSGDWIEQAGNYKTFAAPSAVGQSSLNIAVLNGVSVTNVTVDANVTLAANSYFGLLTRYTGPGDASNYLGNVSRLADGTYQANIYKSVGGAYTVVGSTASKTSFAGSIRFFVNGSTLTLQMDGITVVTFTDTSISGAGTVGMRSGTNATVNSFSAS